MSPIKVHVTVPALSDVQRVLTLLTGRRYPLTRFEAEEAGAGSWRVSIDTVVGADEADLLEARLHRLPSVLAVDLRRSAVLSAVG
jgi:hypothetical protein